MYTGGGSCRPLTSGTRAESQDINIDSTDAYDMKPTCRETKLEERMKEGTFTQAQARFPLVSIKVG